MENHISVSYTHLIPDRARQRILDIASTQFEDGSAYHQYQPLTKKGNSDIGSGFNDDPLWLIAGTAAYIKETGDYSILDERTPYDNDDSKATDLMEHLRRSFHYTCLLYTSLKVVRVMGWCDLHTSGSKLFVYIWISDHRNLTVCHRKF